jgi:hypothetical protein
MEADQPTTKEQKQEEVAVKGGAKLKRKYEEVMKELQVRLSELGKQEFVIKDLQAAVRTQNDMYQQILQQGQVINELNFANSMAHQYFIEKGITEDEFESWCRVQGEKQMAKMNEAKATEMAERETLRKEMESQAKLRADAEELRLKLEGKK